MTITEFLLARITEDEADANRGRSHPDPTTFARDNYGYLWIQPARVLAECSAKRAILEMHEERHYHHGGSAWCSQCAENDDADYEGAPPTEWPCPTLRALAAVWSDHPDYDPNWRP